MYLKVRHFDNHVKPQNCNEIVLWMDFATNWNLRDPEGTVKGGSGLKIASHSTAIRIPYHEDWVQPTRDFDWSWLATIDKDKPAVNYRASKEFDAVHCVISNL